MEDLPKRIKKASKRLSKKTIKPREEEKKNIKSLSKRKETVQEALDVSSGSPFKALDSHLSA